MLDEGVAEEAFSANMFAFVTAAFAGCALAEVIAEADV